MEQKSNKSDGFFPILGASNLPFPLWPTSLLFLDRNNSIVCVCVPVTYNRVSGYYLFSVTKL